MHKHADYNFVSKQKNSDRKFEAAVSKNNQKSLEK